MREFWIRDQKLNYGNDGGADFIAFETPEIEGKGIIHVREVIPDQELSEDLRGEPQQKFPNGNKIDWAKVWSKYDEACRNEDSVHHYKLIQQLVEKQLAGEK